MSVYGFYITVFSQYYCYYCIFNQINAALVGIRAFFQKHWENPLNMSVNEYIHNVVWLMSGVSAGHSKAVRDICFNNTGTQFLSAAYDRYLKLWDSETGESFTLVFISLTNTVCWPAFFPWVRRDKDEATIRSINDNYVYINMQFRCRKKARLKCIQKNKNFTKKLFIFAKKRRQNVIADCFTRLYYASFHECGCQISRFQTLNQSFAVTSSSARCCQNLATMCTHSHLIAEAPPPMIWKQWQTSWRLASKWKRHSAGLCSVMRSRLYCLRLWSLNKCTYSTAVVNLELVVIILL